MSAPSEPQGEPVKTVEHGGFTVTLYGPVSEREGDLLVVAPDGKRTVGMWSVRSTYVDSMGDTSVISLEDDYVLPADVHDEVCSDLHEAVGADTYCLRGSP